MAISDASSPKTTFNSLPLELRRAIWHETFEPRTLSIESSYGYIAEHPPGPTSCLIPRYTGACCYSFTVANGVHPNLNHSPYYLERRFRKTIDAKWHKGWRDGLKSPPLPSKGPVALRVCGESREIALEEYEVAFAGQSLMTRNIGFSELYNSSGIGDKKVWVNWRRDTIFVANVEKVMEISGRPGALGRLRIFGSNGGELASIQRLAVAGHWEMEPTLVRCEVKIALVTALPYFTALKELLVYHSDCNGRVRDIRAAPMMLRSSGQIKNEILEVLQQQKDANEEWTQPLPNVEVSKEMQFYWGGGQFQLGYRSAAEKSSTEVLSIGGRQFPYALQ